ncbi:MAG: alpha/beta hydrolase-fold protein [Buchananella hordeovulneris]|nr:alpha/beta hydrolase-fold protein [Buchananella hordeovulneris]
MPPRFPLLQPSAPPPTPTRLDGLPLRVEGWQELAGGPCAWRSLLSGPLPAVIGRREIDGVSTVAVLFLFRVDDVAPADVLLHLNTLIDRNRADLSAALLEPLGEGWFGGCYWLPADAVLSYAFVVRPSGGFSGLGQCRRTWLEVRLSGRVDPGNPRRIRNGVGRLACLWEGPDYAANSLWHPLEVACSQAGHSSGDAAAAGDTSKQASQQAGGQVAKQVTGPPAGEKTGALPEAQGEAAIAPGLLLELEGEFGARRAHFYRGGPAAQRPLLVLFDAERWLEAGYPWLVQRGGLAGTHDVLLLETGGGRERANLLTDADAVRALVSAALAAVAQQRGHLPARQVAVGGASCAGLAAAQLVASAPHLAATAISLSPSLWVGSGAPRGTGEGELLRGLRAGAIHLPAGVRLYAAVGLHEGEMVERCAQLTAVWRAAGGEAGLRYVRGGHDYAWWRHALSDAVLSWLGR